MTENDDTRSNEITCECIHEINGFRSSTNLWICRYHWLMAMSWKYHWQASISRRKSIKLAYGSKLTMSIQPSRLNQQRSSLSTTEWMNINIVWHRINSSSSLETSSYRITYYELRREMWIIICPFSFESVGKPKKHSKEGSHPVDETTRLTTMSEEDEDNCGISIKVTSINDSEL